MFHVVNNSTEDVLSSSTTRLLQEESRGRTVLTILYLIVLGLCFVVPIFYYFRMHCEDRHARRLREMEMAGVEASLREQQQTSREETRAARKKYREEKRARLLQLFAPVRMTLTEDNFPHLRRQSSTRNIDPHIDPIDPLSHSLSSTQHSTAGPLEAATLENARLANNHNNTSDNDENDDDHDVEAAERDALLRDPDLEEGKSQQQQQQQQQNDDEEAGMSTFDDEAVSDDDDYDLYGEQTVVEIPQAGLSLEQSKKRRCVSNMCAICLSSYEVGDEIVWASNPSCDHAFHKECIERWLIKQRGNPLCPCCRRDFVLDPLDMDEDFEGLLDMESLAPTSNTTESPQNQQPQDQSQQPSPQQPVRQNSLHVGFGM